jgi:Trk-type K+ transport system membrane component
MLRSAGFGFEDLAGFSRATLFASCLFMLIGSSPGSTGGGLKTSTLAAALAGILATLRGNAQATIFGRAVPATQVNKAFAILCMGVASIFLTITLLLMSDPKVKFFGLVFEAISAFSTTGIAIGITQRLSMSGQVILMLAMIAGRIGSLTFIFAFRKPQSKASYRLPEEKIFIG